MYEEGEEEEEMVGTRQVSIWIQMLSPSLILLGGSFGDSCSLEQAQDPTAASLARTSSKPKLTSSATATAQRDLSSSLCAFRAANALRTELK